MPEVARTGYETPRDHGATTHLERYDAYKAFGGPSGFSGHGWALIDTATDRVLFRHAWRNEVLAEQARIEAERGSDA